MKTLSVSIAIFFVSYVSAFAQNKTDYSFINCALQQIDSNASLVSREIYLPHLSLQHFESYKSELTRKIPVKQLREILQNREREILKANSDTLRQSDFPCYKILTRLQIDSLQKVSAKSGSISFSVLSMPVFDNKKNYAVISYGKGTAWKMMSGSHYLFKKVSGRWKLIAWFNNWAS